MTNTRIYRWEWVAVFLIFLGARAFGQTNPYGGRTSCMLYGSGQPNGGATLITGVPMPAFCIENTIRTASTQTSAVSTCSALGSTWGLCTSMELTLACYARYDVSASDSIAQSIAQNAHWSADLRSGTSDLLVGGATCTNNTAVNLTGSSGFRCCLR